MNTNWIKLSAMALVMVFTSCKNDTKEATAEKDAATASEAAVTYTADVKASNIAWKGTKAVGESHEGLIYLESGSVSIKNNQIESGEFVIDMTSIEVTDLEGEKAMSLKAHLEGTGEQGQTDFFNTPKYPKAKFVVTKATMNGTDVKMEGNLTLKDVTKNVTFDATVEMKDDQMMLTSKDFKIDRTQWGIKYGSGSFADLAKDKIISDDLQLKVNLVTKK